MDGTARPSAPPVPDAVADPVPGPGPVPVADPVPDSVADPGPDPGPVSPPHSGPGAVPDAGADEGGASGVAPGSRTRRLILLRHAKSGYPDGVADHDRPLAPRGRTEAALAGAWLTGTQPPVGSVLCSDARRTRETLQRTGIDAPTRLDGRLYGASAGEIIRVLGEVLPQVRTVLLLAHSPGVPQAAAALAGPGSDPEALARLRAGFPTSAIAVLDVPSRWDALQPGTCRLLAVHVPRA